MSEKIATTLLVTPFGTPIRVFNPTRTSKLYKKEIAQFDLDFDKETGSTKVVQKDPLDLDAVIQSYKDQCGMELAQLQIKRGLAGPNDFAAAPGDYGDVSMLPDNINDAYQQAQAAKAAVGTVNLSQFKTDADIQAFVEKAVAAQLAAKEAALKAKTTTTEGGDN